MHRATRTLFALAIAITFAAPVAGATWYFAQSFEPSSDYDTSEWMWQDAPPVGGSRIYFAAFSAYSFVVASANPNVGLLHTQIVTSNSEFQSAMLGVWKDCNGDGYIGLAESAAREYSAALLASTEACPLVEGAATTWAAGAHNYNGWVSELVPIGRDATLTVDRRVYIDDDVRVWGDYHRPDEDPWLRPCPLAPQPRGTYHSTGGAINFVDCRVDVIGVMNLAFDSIGDPMGWHVPDADDARTGTLGQTQTFGSEDSQYSAVTVWDCSSNVRVGTVANNTAPAAGPSLPSAVANLNSTTLAPGPGNVDDATIPGTVNHTREGIRPGGFEDCDYTNDNGGDVYEGVCVVYCVGEGDFNGINPKNKTEAHFNMRFNQGGRGTAPYSALAPLRWNGAGGPPGDHGVGWGNAGTISGWTGTTFWLTKPGFGTIRTHLQDPGNSTVEISPGLWFTWYAYVGQTTIDRGFTLPGATVGDYASWHCDGAASGIHHGFNCDPAQWYRNPDGTPVNPAAGGELEPHELARPGQDYQLRDIDCYDGSLGGADPDAPLGVGIQPAFYGAGACY